MANLQIILLLFTLSAVSLSWGKSLNEHLRRRYRVDHNSTMPRHALMDKAAGAGTMMTRADINSIACCIHHKNNRYSFSDVLDCVEDGMKCKPRKVNRITGNLECCMDDHSIYKEFRWCARGRDSCEYDSSTEYVEKFTCCMNKAVANSNSDFSSFQDCLSSDSETCTPVTTTTPAPTTAPGECLNQAALDTAAATNNKIVGGNEVEAHSSPHMAALINPSSGSLGCGASILNERTIITAAHCMGWNFKVLVGEHDFSDSSDGQQVMDVASKITHPHYDSNTLENDVAIVILKESLQFGPTISPLCVPKQCYDNTVVDCIVTGWGTTDYGGSVSYTLQGVTVPKLSVSQCKNAYPNLFVEDNMICAGGDTKDSCQGDSGGPLTCGDELTGIVSWGHKCAEPGYPGVYANVCHNGDFIEVNMWTEGSRANKTV